jgi:hypothetical protein
MFYESLKDFVSLLGYIDFDWEGDATDKHSIAEYVFQLGLGPIS